MTYMMIDDDVAFMSCSSVYRILCEAGIMRSKDSKPSKKRTGFEHKYIIRKQFSLLEVLTVDIVPWTL